jgi:beta-glucosidase
MFQERTLDFGAPGIDSEDSDDYHESILCGTHHEMSGLKDARKKLMDGAKMQNEAFEGWKKMNKMKQDQLAEVRSKWDAAEERARKALDSMDQWAKVSLLKGVPESGTGYAGFIQGGNVRMTMNDGPQGYNGYTKDTASKSTQFPALLSIAASFNPETSWKYAQAVAEEFTAKGSNVLLGPDVEIIRSPLSGRSFETLTGEDPYLGSELVRPFVRAVQAKGIIATVKHWLDNNQEIYRQSMNVEVGDREQHEIYMPVFKAAFEAGAGSVMCAYNKVYGEHACENQKLLHDLLREDLGFRGFVVSDWGATHDGVKSAFAGLDVEMPQGDAFSSLNAEEHADRIDRMAGHVLSSWFASGQADGLFGADAGAWPGSPTSNARTDAHLNVARETIVDSAVLLKNKDGVLPLQGAGKKIVLVGRYCDQGADSDFLQGSVYSGGGSGYVESFTLATPYTGIKQKFPDAASVTLAQTADDVDSADVAIVCVSAHAEEGWDRTDTKIPDAWDLVHGLREKDSGMTIVVLAISPGVVNTGWMWDADAALMLFMPGEQVGVAVAQLLNGEASPGGRLPVSLPGDDEERYTKDQYPGTCPPPHTWCKDMTANFSEGVLIGYRWNDAMGVPSAFPFGYGLTYTEFEFTNQNVLCSKERAVVSMTVKNIGWREGTAVPQLYVSFPSLRPVVRQLRGFQKVFVEKDGEVNVAFFLGPEDWSYYDVAAQAWVSAASKGENITVSLGSSSTDLPWNRTFSC